MLTRRLFFPTKGRLHRCVNRRKQEGYTFCGSVRAFMWGPFCSFLVFSDDLAPPATNG